MLTEDQKFINKITSKGHVIHASIRAQDRHKVSEILGKSCMYTTPHGLGSKLHIYYVMDGHYIQYIPIEDDIIEFHPGDAFTWEISTNRCTVSGRVYDYFLLEAYARD